MPSYDKVINDPTLPNYVSQFLSFKQDLKLLEIKCKNNIIILFNKKFFSFGIASMSRKKINDSI